MYVGRTLKKNTLINILIENNAFVKYKQDEIQTQEDYSEKRNSYKRDRINKFQQIGYTVNLRKSPRKQNKKTKRLKNRR